MTIHDAINEYLKQCEARKLSWSTLKAYRCDLEILDRSQRHTELLDIESEELQKIIKGNGSLKPATMLRRSVSFHIFFQYCKEKGYIQETPVIKSQRVKLQTPVTMTADKVTVINRELYSTPKEGKFYWEKSRNMAIVELLYATGMRISELCALKKDDIQFFDEFIIVSMHGNGKRERKFLITNKQVITALQTYQSDVDTASVDVVDSDAVFINRRGRAVSEQTVRYCLKNYNITPKILRNSAAKEMYDSGMNIFRLQGTLGLNSIDSAERFCCRQELENKRTYSLSDCDLRNRLSV